MKVKFSEAGSWQTAEAKPGLTLYIPAIRRTVTLNRKHISFGSSKFRDLDLSQVPGWEQAPANLGDFRFEDGVWYLEPRQGAEDLRVNGWPQDRECRAVKLEPGDRIEIGDARLVIRGCAEPGVSGGPELEQNFVLMFQSISLNRGHIGIQIRFDAARRVLIREDWGIVGDKKLTDPPQERPVPEDITTREQLYRFANRSGWEYCSEPEKMYDQDVLLWLSPEAQVQYIAERERFCTGNGFRMLTVTRNCRNIGPALSEPAPMRGRSGTMSAGHGPISPTTGGENWTAIWCCPCPQMRIS